MFGYVLKLPSSLPKTVWACKTTVNSYHWNNNNKADMIEFSRACAAERTLVIGGYGECVLRGETFSCLVGDTDVRSYADDGVEVGISSIAVRFSELSFEARDFEERDISDNSVLLLPHIIDGLSEQELSRIDRLMHRYISSYIEKSAASEMECASIVFELLSMIDTHARRHSAIKKDKYVNYYVNKADSVISKRYAEKLTLNLVAGELGITPSYLSAIYKSSMGVGFSERLLEVRMNKARELLLNGELTVGEIASRVGFGDESHLRRRFKQYFGATIREYRCISQEQTLYHKKPTVND